MRYFVYCRKSSEADDRQVMSIQSQRSELERVFAGRDDIEIVETFEEAKSAKTPGRPIFADMIARIELGEAAGIIAWAPDRLARNSIDGGRVVYLLDTGALRDLKFATYTFENNSQGKFMLQIMFGQSKYYSDALSENVKRGNRTKVQNGWRPNLAPFGYLNDKSTKTIVKDPELFPIVRRIFDLYLSGSCTPRQIAVLARDEWGFRTPVRRKIGGTPLSMSSLYHLLLNPFYAGYFNWNGDLYQGRHEPMISLADHERICERLRRPSPIRPKLNEFAFTGLMRCGGCSRQVTAENKVNRFGSRYTYYHCSRHRLGTPCREPAIEVRALEAQIVAFLSSIRIHQAIAGVLASLLKGNDDEVEQRRQAQRRSLQSLLDGSKSQREELVGLRIRRMIDDEEFASRRRNLEREEALTAEKLGALEPSAKPLSPYEALNSFCICAGEWFRNGGVGTKRLILETVGSNPTLSGRKLNIQAAFPFTTLMNLANSPSLLARCHEDRTLGVVRQELDEIRAWFETESGELLATRLQRLTELVASDQAGGPKLALSGHRRSEAGDRSRSGPGRG